MRRCESITDFQFAVLGVSDEEFIVASPIIRCDGLLSVDATAIASCSFTHDGRNINGDHEYLVWGSHIPVSHCTSITMAYPRNPFDSLPNLARRDNVPEAFPRIFRRNDMNIATYIPAAIDRISPCPTVSPGNPADTSCRRAQPAGHTCS